jgi:Phage integrase, N-terminal SAM-like domain.
MADEAMNPLRRRMIEDMKIRKLAPKTQHDDVQRVKNFAAFLGRSPDMASFEDVRRYQLHLATSGVGVPTINQTVSTLRFFFRVTLTRHDIFRDRGPAWRKAHAGHVSLEQLKMMSAIENCRTALGGHVARCEDCAYTTIASNSCRSRHCPKCQGAAAKEWLAAREADLLPVPYYHVVFTLPAPIADVAYQNKAGLRARCNPSCSECSRKKRSISLVASGPSGSVQEPAGLPPDQTCPTPWIFQCSNIPRPVASLRTVRV